MACMGGWCRKREQCADYHDRIGYLVERFCDPGKDDPTPMIRREWVPAGQWQVSHRVGSADAFSSMVAVLGDR